MDARTRKLAGLALAAVGVVLAVVGGLADQIGIGANEDGEMGGKQVAALVVGVLLVIGGIVLATVLAKDAGAADGGDTGDAATAAGTDGTDGTGATDTPAAGTPVAETTDAAVASGSEPVETTDSSD